MSSDDVTSTEITGMDMDTNSAARSMHVVSLQTEKKYNKIIKQAFKYIDPSPQTSEPLCVGKLGKI